MKENSMRIRMHIGVSLDGFAATPDGVPAFDAVPDFVPRESHGLPEFIEQCAAVVVGRATFDEGRAYWSETSDWAPEPATVPPLAAPPAYPSSATSRAARQG
jgi:hypothetical protein